jgi:hypothetical protein
VAITSTIFYKAGKWCPIGINDESIGGSTTTCVTSVFLPEINTNNCGDDGNGKVGVDVDPIVISTIHLDARSEEKKCHPVHSLDADTTRAMGHLGG